MKKLAVGLALASVFGGSVFAADLPADMPVYAPRASVVPPLYSWTGCFIGANVGGGFSGTTFKDATTLISLGTNNAATGFFGGGQVGCDYQFGWAVFGIQGMFDGIRATSNNIWFPEAGPTAVNTTSLRWLSTVTARLGIAPTPTLMVYLRGGLPGLLTITAYRLSRAKTCLPQALPGTAGLLVSDWSGDLHQIGRCLPNITTPTSLPKPSDLMR